MAQPEFLIIGDSNVKRFYTRIGLAQAQNINFVQARNVNELSTAISSVSDAYKYVVLAFITNLIVDAASPAANDVDRASAVEEMYNTVIPLIR